jgi:hypothetical protein
MQETRPDPKGLMKSMQDLAADFGRSFLKGQAAAAALFSPG